MSLLLHFYKPFTLEEKVSSLYKKLNIHTPDEIVEWKIAKKLGIHLIYSEKRYYSAESDELKLININSSSKEKFFIMNYAIY